jgi:hypothetical protein
LKSFWFSTKIVHSVEIRGEEMNEKCVWWLFSFPNFQKSFFPIFLCGIWSF